MLRKLAFSTVPRVYLFVSVLMMCFSCTSTKSVTIFNGAENGLIASNTPVPESIIQKNDILGIAVSSLNPEASAIFNPGGPTSPASTSPTTAATTQGYLVGTDGNIQFPLLGAIKAEGLSKAQLKDKITSSILEKKLLLDPIVAIRFLNFRVTVLGEVNHPSVVTVPNEKISLLEALGLAGDLTLYARRDNVMVIREVKDQKMITRLNLSSTELFTSPYYYLQSNDIVYVEPNKAKVSSTGRAWQWMPTVFAGLSLTILLLDHFDNN